MIQNQKKLTSELKDSSKKNNDEVSQDWVCLKCNNLNYSFRTKCNRCKVQSREDNEHQLYADYYYYNQYYNYHPAQETPQIATFDNAVSLIEEARTPHKNYRSQSQLSITEDDHLPSISPLIKRYKAGQQKVNRKAKKSIFGWKLFQAESWSESQLPVINVSNVCKDLSCTDDEQASQQFAKSVQQMIF